jgi:hypothetical protein
MLAAPLGWLLALGAWGALQREIGLGGDGVHVRRWTEVWLGATGSRLGPPESLHASLDGAWVTIAGPDLRARVGIRTWGSTARADLVDELPTWGVDCDFGRHGGHHRGRRRRHDGDRRRAS